MSKILVLDVETKPSLAYVWKLFDENISVDQLVESTSIICWAAKWYGKKPVYFRADWEKGGRLGMLEEMHALISEADALVTFNGDHFDLPKLAGEFLREGMAPPPPVASIDLYKTVKRLGFQSGRLAYIGPHLGIGAKVKHEGFGLWRAVMNEDAGARKRMEKYNRQDTVLTDKLYAKLLPYIKNHPYLGTVGKTSCPSCGSRNVQKRGERRTKNFFIERLHCQSCGAWADGARRKAK